MEPFIHLKNVSIKSLVFVERKKDSGAKRGEYFKEGRVNRAKCHKEGQRIKTEESCSLNVTKRSLVAWMRTISME